MVIAESPDMSEKLHGLSSTINLFISSTTGKYGGKRGAPDLIISMGFSLSNCGLHLGAELIVSCETEEELVVAVKSNE